MSGSDPTAHHSTSSGETFRDSHKDFDKDELEENGYLPSEWERCQCELATCDSCVAEWLATIDDDEHMCNQRHVREKFKALTQPPGVWTAADGATFRKLTSCCIRKAFKGNQGDVSRVHISKGPEGYTDRLFIYWYHPAVSDSTIDGRTQFSYASAIVALRFAYNFHNDPSKLTVEGPPAKLFGQVINSIREGNTRYDAFYYGRTVELGPKETLSTCEEMQLKLLFQENVYADIVPLICQYIVNLQQGQILLVYRYKPYKVVSVMLTEDPEFVCLFDSQIHNITVDFKSGAMLFVSEKDWRTVGLMWAQFQVQVLPYQGKCTVLLLEC